MEKREDFTHVLELASEAGHILLENGAEIARVEDIMARICTHYGVDSKNFFIVSNGIFTSGKAGKVEKSGGQASTYANIDFIPIRGSQLNKVTAVNRLSYEISQGKYTVREARECLAAIKQLPRKPGWLQILASGIASGGFAIIFGGAWADCLAATLAGLLLYVFILYVSNRYLSKIVGAICNALVVMLFSITFWRLGLGESLSNIIVGAIMPLVPGVAFTNGVRDLANSDHLAGLTRLTDALLGFFCIALGVSVAFMLDGWLFGGLIDLPGVTLSPETSGFFWQALGAFGGTWGFAVLYTVDKEQYLVSGFVGVMGWMVYLLALRFGQFSAPISTLFAAVMVCLLSRFAAVPTRCPAQVFIICGIFPLVPGAGLFWFSYYLTAGELALSSHYGFVAVKVAISIVLGIILAMELPQRWFSGRRKAAH